MTRHISIEHNEPPLCEELFKRYSVPMNDLTIGHLVMQLMRHPAQLRTFSLYITAASNFGLARALVMNNANAIALRRLRARLDKLTIVTYGPDNSPEGLRMFLAPEIEWSRQKFRDWPRITMHWKVFTTIYLSIFFDESRCGQGAQAWHTSRLGSVETELWEEPPKGRYWDRASDSDQVASRCMS